MFVKRLAVVDGGFLADDDDIFVWHFVVDMAAATKVRQSLSAARLCLLRRMNAYGYSP